MKMAESASRQPLTKSYDTAFARSCISSINYTGWMGLRIEMTSVKVTKLMMYFKLVVLLFVTELVDAQHTENAARCVANSPITAFDGCKAWDSLVTSCGSYAETSDADGYFNCYCQQAYLNALYE